MAASFISITPDRSEDLLHLCANSLSLDPFSLELLDRRVFNDPRFDPELTLGSIQAGKLVAAAIAVERILPTGQHHGWIKLFAVAPAARGHGLGAALIAELERRFRRRRLPQIDTVGYPHYFWPGVDVRYTPACCLLETLGFKEARSLVNMAVDLNQPFDDAAAEQRLVHDGFTFHRADATVASELVTFIERDWPIWRDEVPLALANEPSSMFYCRHAGRIVAYAAYDIAMFPGTFGSMGTDPAFRGRGLGAVLLRKCLADMQAKRYPRCEIAWVGPVGFYARQVGAHINRVFRDYQKNLTD
jgi:ribosomal protein S18 acetylase RimI-like enzyme